MLSRVPIVLNQTRGPFRLGRGVLGGWETEVGRVRGATGVGAGGGTIDTPGTVRARAECGGSERKRTREMEVQTDESGQEGVNQGCSGGGLPKGRDRGTSVVLTTERSHTGTYDRS